MIKLVNQNKFLIFVLLLALGMRLVALNQSFWLDEAIGVEAVQKYSYFGILNEFLKSDNHPPLYYLDLKLWSSIFGFSEIAVRMHTVLYGVATVLMVYVVSREIFPKNMRVVQIAAILMATSPFHIYYSQEARMYSLTAFLALSAVYFFWRSIKKSNPSDYLGFSVSITFLVFTDYVPVFLVPVFIIWVVFLTRDKSIVMKHLLTYLPLLVLFLFWWPIFSVQIGKGGWLLNALPQWSSVAGGASTKEAALVWMKFVLGRISFANKKLYYGLVLLSSVPFSASLYMAARRREKGVLFLWMWLILPLFLVFVVSFWFPAFIYFRFLFVLPAFYVLLSYGVERIRNSRLSFFLIVSLTIVNFLGWGIYVSQPQQQREQWRQATDYIVENIKSDEIVLFSYPDPFTPFRLYSKGAVEAYGAMTSITLRENETSERIRDLVSASGGVYYFEYLADLTDRDRFVLSEIEKNGFETKKVNGDFIGVGRIYYLQEDD